MSSKLNKLIREAIELPVHDLGYKKEVPEGELSSFMEEDEEDKDKEMVESEDSDEDDMVQESEDEDEDDLEEDFSVSDYEKKLPVHSLGYEDEVPDEELLALIGGEEERDEADLDLGSDQILPNPDVNESEDKDEDDMVKESEDEGEDEEEEEDDFEDAVNEALKLLSKKSKKKVLKEEEEEEKLDEDDMPDDATYHKDGDEEGEEKRTMDEEEESEEDEDEDKDLEEGLSAIFKGNKLSQAFKKKTATIFESTVKSRINKERAKLRKAYSVASQAHRKLQEDRLVNKLSDYLDYAVNEWTKQNKVALESSIKNQITEEFMEGLKNLFESKYIEVPKTKTNLFASLEKKVKVLESKLNEQTKANIDLHKSLKKTKKELIIKKACEGLTDSNKERLVSLTENFEYTNAKEFAEKVLTIRKSFFEKSSNKSKATNNRMTKSGININESESGDADVDPFLNAFRTRGL